MTESLKLLERMAFRSFWDDGLLDVMSGLAIVLVGFSWWQDLVPLGAVFPAVAVSLWYPLRKKLIEPRTGYVEFTGKRELKTRSFRHGMVVFLAGTMMLGAAVFLFWNQGALSGVRVLVAGMPAALIALLAVPLAIFTGCARYFAYAAVMLFAGAATAFLRLEPGPPMLAGGALITLAGLAILVRFLKSHPAGTGTVA